MKTSAKVMAIALGLSLSCTSFAASVCTSTGGGHDNSFYGTVVCSKGTISELNVNGDLSMNGTTVKGDVSIKGNAKIKNATMDNLNIHGNLTSNHSTFNGNINSVGEVDLNNHSLVRGDVNSAMGQVNIDASSKVNGTVMTAS